MKVKHIVHFCLFISVNLGNDARIRDTYITPLNSLTGPKIPIRNSYVTQVFLNLRNSTRISSSWNLQEPCKILLSPPICYLLKGSTVWSQHMHPGLAVSCRRVGLGFRLLANKISGCYCSTEKEFLVLGNDLSQEVTHVHSGNRALFRKQSASNQNQIKPKFGFLCYISRSQTLVWCNSIQLWKLNQLNHPILWIPIM